jgi:DNA-binding response OmpR family regulator
MATIVIVEDEPQISALVQSFIEEQGHKVLSAATADEALGILKGPHAVDALLKWPPFGRTLKRLRSEQT